jgi:tetratricopeptide (TPR) repeat protein
MKRIAIIAPALFLLTALLAACGNGGSEALDEVESLLADGRWVEARDALLESHGEAPGGTSAGVLLARAQRECGHAEGARRALSAVRAADRERPDVLEERIRTLLALEEVERALARDHYLGRAQRGAKFRTEAASLARTLAERSKATASDRLLAAEVLAGIRGGIGEAQSWLGEARRSGDADGSQVVFLRALLALRRQESDQARKLLMAEAPPDRTEHVESLRLHAALLVRAGDPDRARRLLDRAHRLDSSHPGAAIDLARMVRAAGDLEEAVRIAGRVLEIRPDHVPTLRDRARSLGGLVRWSDAIDDYRHARRLRPKDASILDGLGMALFEGAEWKNERMHEASEVHRAGIALEPGHLQNRFNLARSLVKSNRTEKLKEAIRLYEGLVPRLRALPPALRQPGGYWFTLERDVHRNVGLVLSDSFKRWDEAYVHYVAFFEMGGRPEDDPTGGILDEWRKVLEGRGEPYRHPPGPR